MTGGAGGDDGEDVNSLLNAIRTVAREEDAEIANLPAALSPVLSDVTRGLIADEIMRAQAREREQKTQPQPQPSANLAPGVDALELRRQARQRSRRAFVLTGGGLVVAAAAGFMMWMRPSGDVPGASLPGYEVTASGGVAELRGGKSDTAVADGTTTATQRLRAESELRVTCRPDSAIEGPVAVRAFFVQGNDAAEVRPLVVVAATGAAELRLRGVDLLGGHRGHGNLRIVLGRPDAVRAVAARVAVDPSGASALRWLTVPLDLENP
jgi:hypothetical protein